jgi:carbonic anhydrase
VIFAILKKMPGMLKKKLAARFRRPEKQSPAAGSLPSSEGIGPDVFVINCIESCSDANLVFDAAPGQQFVRSQVAAIVPPYSAENPSELDASLGYAIDTRKVRHLVVLGHSQCDALAALLNGEASGPYLEAWVKIALQAKEAAKNKAFTGKGPVSLQRETERQAVIMSLQNLMDYPVVQKALQKEQLAVSGWFFDVENGALHEYDPETKTFRRLDAPSPAPSRQNTQPIRLRR